MAATNDYSSWIHLQGVFLITYLCSLCKTAHHYYLELKMTPSNVFFTQATVSTDMGLLKKLEQLLMSIKTKCIQLLVSRGSECVTNADGIYHAVDSAMGNTEETQTYERGTERPRVR